MRSKNHQRDQTTGDCRENKAAAPNARLEDEQNPGEPCKADADIVPGSDQMQPALTTVRQPLEQMGRTATQMLLEILNNPEKKPNRISLPTELIVRDSTAKPKDRPG